MEDYKKTLNKLRDEMTAVNEDIINNYHKIVKTGSDYILMFNGKSKEVEKFTNIAAGLTSQLHKLALDADFVNSIAEKVLDPSKASL